MGCHQNVEVNGYVILHQLNTTHGTHRTWGGGGGGGGGVLTQDTFITNA